MANTRQHKRRKASLGILFWIAFILLVLILFLINRPQINRVLENTGFLTVLSETFGPEDTEQPSDSQDQDPFALEDGETEAETDGANENTRPDIELEPIEPRSGNDTSGEQNERNQDDEGSADADAQSEDRDDGNEFAVEPAQDDSSDAETTTEPEQEQEQGQETARRGANLRVANIYYIRVADDGRIYPQRVQRNVYFDTSPMTDTLRVLLAGPNSEELNQGLLNLIPQGTRLISAAVRDGTAYLNFNEEFTFNPMGREGLRAQLQQIIYSVTEFSTIDRVQFLIDGEQVEYLGAEGLYVGRPLDRASFS